MARTGCLAMMGWALACGGCSRPAIPDSPSTLRIELRGPQDYEEQWAAVRELLREDGYPPAMVDRTNGRLTTHSVSSSHFFEIWRHDVHSAYDWAEATVAPIRRRVEVHFPPPMEDAGTTELSLTVLKERLSSPERQFNESGSLFQFFGDVLPAGTGSAHLQPEDDRWVDLARDPAMESYLMHRVAERIGAGPSAPREVVPESADSSPEPEVEPDGGSETHDERNP